MKKSFAAPLLATFPALVKVNWPKTCACTVALLALGCTNTQVRWDATRMRQDVMVYYNDQIMDNLIRAKNDLPFVHVDIQLLTSQGGVANNWHDWQRRNQDLDNGPRRHGGLELH